MTDVIDLLGKSILPDNMTHWQQINLSNNSLRQKDVSYELYYVYCAQ